MKTNIINQINNKISDKITGSLQKAASNKIVKTILIILLSIYIIGFSYYMISSFSLRQEFDKGIYELLFALLFAFSLWILAFMFKANKLKKKALKRSNNNNKPDNNETL